MRQRGKIGRAFLAGYLAVSLVGRQFSFACERLSDKHVFFNRAYGTCITMAEEAKKRAGIAAVDNHVQVVHVTQMLKYIRFVVLPALAA